MSRLQQSKKKAQILADNKRIVNLSFFHLCCDFIANIIIIFIINGLVGLCFGKINRKSKNGNYSCYGVLSSYVNNHFR